MQYHDNSLINSRLIKLNKIKELGIDPYPARYSRTSDILTSVNNFIEQESESSDPHNDDGDKITLAGRIIAIRGMGKAKFIDIRDYSDRIQILFRSNVLGEQFELLDHLDIGDFIGAKGNVMRTRTGQVTLHADEFTILCKGIRPLPEKFHGLKDTETRYRQRYLDLIANEEVISTFANRSKLLTALREFMNDRGFIEVETPVLVPIPAGAHAKPFVTFHNALDENLYLRIATELYLKRLIIGGFDKVYEIGRVFRNEGVDQNHNPEFTLLESYESYADYNDVMSMVESLINHLALKINGSSEIAWGDHKINLSPPWPRLSLREELLNRAGIDIDEYPDDQSLSQKARELGLDVTNLENRGRLIDKMLGDFIEPHLIQPTFLIDYPEVMSPLAKSHPSKPGYVERFEAYIAGMEIANSYSELNDPVIQRTRLEGQEQIRDMYGDDELDRLDEDFLTAIELGMPPTGGLGMGIDRLVMLLTEEISIRDAIIFPHMRTLK